MSWHKKDWLKLLGGLVAGAAAAPLLGPAAAALGLGGAGAGAAGAGAAGAAGAGAASGATSAITSKGLGSALTGLLKTAGKQTATSLATGAAMDAISPSYGMTTPGSVPQLAPVEDPLMAIQELMRKSKTGRIV